MKSPRLLGVVARLKLLARCSPRTLSSRSSWSHCSCTKCAAFVSSAFPPGCCPATCVYTCALIDITRHCIAWKWCRLLVCGACILVYTPDVLGVLLGRLGSIYMCGSRMRSQCKAEASCNIYVRTTRPKEPKSLVSYIHWLRRQLTVCTCRGTDRLGST